MLIRATVILLLCCVVLACGAGATETGAPEGRAKGESSSSKKQKKAKKAEARAVAAEAEGRELAGEPVVSSGYEVPVEIGTLEDPSVTESSGIVASRRNAGLFWTHNDSGDAPLLYAFDARGRRRGVWRVAGAQARDWEDIAAGPGTEARRAYLYVGDIGDNRERRAEVVVYRVGEPAVNAGDAASTKTKPRLTEPAEALRFRYPDASHNAEALLVHPTSGDIYIVTKTMTATAYVFKASAPFDALRTTTLAFVGEVRVPAVLGGLITGGDIAPDGRRLVLCDYFNGYEFRLVSGDAKKSFDAIWQQTPVRIPLGTRQQGEAIGYALDGNSLFATSEKRPAALIQIRRSTK